MADQAELTLLLEAFARNGEVNAALMADIGEQDLDVSDGVGGYTIGQHLGHLAEFRHGWLSRISPSHAEGLPEVLDGDETAIWLTTRSPADIAAALVAGDRAAVEAVTSAVAEGRSFERAYRSHPAQFLVHTIVHDAHHRGQVLSLLRTSGRRTAEQREASEDVAWPIWRR